MQLGCYIVPAAFMVSSETHAASAFTSEDVTSFQELLNKATASLHCCDASQDTIDAVYAFIAAMDDATSSLQMMAGRRQAELDKPKDRNLVLEEVERLDLERRAYFECENVKKCLKVNLHRGLVGKQMTAKRYSDALETLLKKGKLVYKDGWLEIP
ncbi:hypothetical protein QFC20_007760 [Naganishia adeliensis]|uniref:Uncharacterized protein n=1 Tax=Naganishia adeliensis TaxID=92952 RepID=A0ACC2UVU8_9TREE|nr:hypothetical protein QFC20_007760 [Naganishia adeliensis]